MVLTQWTRTIYADPNRAVPAHDIGVHTAPALEEEAPVLFPTRQARRGIRSWWREHITGPLDEVYAQLDEHQQDDDRS